MRMEMPENEVSDSTSFNKPLYQELRIAIWWLVSLYIIMQPLSLYGLVIQNNLTR